MLFMTPQGIGIDHKRKDGILMSKVAVIFWSGTGNTEAMAQAVAEGAKAAGAEADLLTCTEVNGVEAYDAVALGCPAMGAEELEDSEFLPMLESIEATVNEAPDDDGLADCKALGAALA